MVAGARPAAVDLQGAGEGGRRGGDGVSAQSHGSSRPQSKAGLRWREAPPSQLGGLEPATPAGTHTLSEAPGSGPSGGLANLGLWLHPSHCPHPRVASPA